MAWVQFSSVQSLSCVWLCSPMDGSTPWNSALKKERKKKKTVIMHPVASLHGKQKGKQWQIIFLGSKITADGDCSHEIKRCLPLGRKAMTNLDSVLKSKDITLLTKAHTVIAMAFPVVMYRCESWTIRRLNAEELMLLNCEFWIFNRWRRVLRVPWTSRTSNQSILKEVSPEYSLEGLQLKLKLQYLGHWCKELTHWKRPWGWERLKAKDEGGRGWDD